MKQTLPIGKLGLAIALGMVGLVGILPVRAQDDSEKKDEPPKLEEPVDSPTPASKESGEEEKGHVWRDGKDVVMIGNDFVLKGDEVANDVVVVSGNATIEGRVSRDLVLVGGSAKVLGRVDGELVVILGSASLGPAAELGNDVTVVGGTLTREPGSKIEGT